MRDPPFLLGVVFWPGFFLESVEGGGVFGFLSVDGLVFTYGQGTPPLPFLVYELVNFL